MKNKRISKDQYYLNIAREVPGRAVCLRRVYGAIVVCKDQIVSTGYTGAPRKTLDCFEHGFCLREKLEIPSGQRYELCRSVHAEANAIINAARAGVSLLGGDIYIFAYSQKRKEAVDGSPCIMCKKMIINAGLKRVICSTADNGMKIYHVADWIKEWQEKDIVDSRNKYR